MAWPPTTAGTPPNVLANRGGDVADRQYVLVPKLATYAPSRPRFPTVENDLERECYEPRGARSPKEPQSQRRVTHMEVRAGTGTNRGHQQLLEAPPSGPVRRDDEQSRRDLRSKAVHVPGRRPRGWCTQLRGQCPARLVDANGPASEAHRCAMGSDRLSIGHQVGLAVQPRDRTRGLPRSMNSAGPGRDFCLGQSVPPSQTRMHRRPRGRQCP